MVIRQEFLDAFAGAIDDQAMLGIDDPVAEAQRLAALLRLPGPGPWARVLGPVYNSETVARGLGISRQAADQRRRRHELVAVKSADGQLAWPTWQFSTSGGRVHALDGLAELLAILVPAADDLAAVRWLRTPNRRLDGSDPITVLERNGSSTALVSAARAQADVWAGTAE